MTHTTLAIYTGKSIKTIIDDGGSQSWVLDHKKARQHDFAVLCYNPNAKWSKEAIAHGAAFLVGRISNIVESLEVPGRWLVLFNEYAEINIKDTWGGWRNPIKYTTLEELGIDFSALSFKAIPVKKTAPLTVASTVAKSLTIKEAKAGLALTFGIEPKSIDITIRG